LILLINSQLTQ